MHGNWNFASARVCLFFCHVIVLINTWLPFVQTFCLQSSIVIKNYHYFLLWSSSSFNTLNDCLPHFFFSFLLYFDSAEPAWGTSEWHESGCDTTSQYAVQDPTSVGPPADVWEEHPEPSHQSRDRATTSAGGTQWAKRSGGHQKILSKILILLEYQLYKVNL